MRGVGVGGVFWPMAMLTLKGYYSKNGAEATEQWFLSLH